MFAIDLFLATAAPEFFFSLNNLMRESLKDSMISTVLSIDKSSVIKSSQSLYV